MSAAEMEADLIPGSADREDVDPTSTSIAFEPCRVEDALPAELIAPTSDRAAQRVTATPRLDSGKLLTVRTAQHQRVCQPRSNADAYRLLTTMMDSRRPRGWRVWAEVVWGDLRAPDYIGDMPHTWIAAEFVTAIRRMLLNENGRTLALFGGAPDALVG